jgi:hypothetical protein
MRANWTAFEWQAPAMPTTPAEATEGEAGALVPLESLRLHQALLVDAQRREEAASTEAAELRARVEALQNELGRAQGELAAVKASAAIARLAWWRRIFGGREG